ncbi:MAG: histidinol-phosphate transaminase [Flavobacteriia bacterium]|nr:MAG: histidinol-phosphate transaminase [Flavobacteriia bacterium]
MNKRSIDIKKLVRPNIMGLKPYSSARNEFSDADKKMVFLDANENPFDNGLNRYPDPLQSTLKEKISELKGLPAENILLGNGSDEVLDLLFRAFCNPGKDNILTFPPTYGMYQVLADINDVKVKEVLLNDTFQIDMEKALQEIDDETKIIFICSPNNPTGNLMEEESVVRLLESFNGLVVVDEAYIDFADSKSWLEKINEYNNLVVTQTFSKAFGKAGIRLGICFADQEVIEILNSIKPPYNVNILTQEEGLNTLDEYGNILKQKEQIKIYKNQLLSDIQNISFIKEIYKTDANFVLIRVDDADKRYQQILEKGIVVRNRNTQPKCKNCLRITMGTEEQNKELYKVLKSIES